MGGRAGGVGEAEAKLRTALMALREGAADRGVGCVEGKKREGAADKGVEGGEGKNKAGKRVAPPREMALREAALRSKLSHPHQV